jgi:DNA-binding XRE family transcriptional regulator
MTSAYDQGHVPPIEVHHRLRIAREYAGYDQDQLAKAIGISRNTVGNAEKAKVAPRTIVVNAWAMACGVPRDWILTGKHPTDHPDGGSGLGIIRTERSAATQQTSAGRRNRSA